MNMRASQIKGELKERGIDFSDCFDQESLADKLVKVRAGMIEAPLPPRVVGAGKGNFDFGMESKQGQDKSMEDAFKAAGWTGTSSEEVSNVDTARSPGLSRNFGAVDSKDFRKPYTPGRG